ncbi:hypothetical protein [Ralstonia pseudosolanacearum]|uniref:hypothetical protein n=1 Tax=Ralstonia pseudosolanacearum TaxID=1310165 RepID=UPI0015A4315E|nr:hypothetical protein [Ralstonia pseudosolanacearum]MCL1622575.1 hypothetical protein [Ralstonia pseudosolanacearum CaRs-Mep]MCQ4682716.1 hypothetical protein [Ralstonia pseudosolanacearum]
MRIFDKFKLAILHFNIKESYAKSPIPINAIRAKNAANPANLWGKEYYYLQANNIPG